MTGTGNPDRFSNSATFMRSKDIIKNREIDATGEVIVEADSVRFKDKGTKRVGRPKNN